MIDHFGIHKLRQGQTCALKLALLVIALLVPFLSKLHAATSPYTDSDDFLSAHLFESKWTGDLQEIKKRRLIRVLIVCDDMFYFLDRGKQRGITYEYMKHFETFLNRKLGRRSSLRINLVFIPTTREKLLTMLNQGYGDIAAANLTITRKRLKHVDFTEPIARNISELLVTGPSAPRVEKIADLSGRSILVRFASSYYEHLQEINRIFKDRGMKPIRLREASTYFQDSDMLQMVNAGVIPWAVVDSHKARLWASVLPKIKVRENVVIHSGGEIAWALRKNSPELKSILNQFVRKNRQGTLVGNILINRYLKNNRWIKNPAHKRAMKRFNRAMELFRKYGKEYGFDWLMLAALAYQESELDNGKRSHRGAVGIMQMLPSTARDPNVNVRDIRSLENNIKAGTRYLRFLRDRYFSDAGSDELNRMLFTFAAYNAGPRRIVQARQQAKAMHLDPDVWFHNVEVAVAKKIGRETVTYVSNIYKYYIAYRLIVESPGNEYGDGSLAWSLGKL